MQLGLGTLGLAPDVFWALTPRELHAALRGAGVLVADTKKLDRKALEALMAASPDSDESQSAKPFEGRKKIG